MNENLTFMFNKNFLLILEKTFLPKTKLIKYFLPLFLHYT